MYLHDKPYAAPVASCCLPCCAVVMAQSVASLFLLLLMLTNGFSIVVTSIPWYIRWLYWSNPLVRALLLGPAAAAARCWACCVQDRRPNLMRTGGACAQHPQNRCIWHPERYSIMYCSLGGP